MKKIIHTPKAPAPIGPYSQATMVGDVLYTSGQIALDPITGNLIEGGDRRRNKTSNENLEAVLEAAGMTFENVFKTTIFLKDMHQFSQVNAIYGSYFNDETAPARETVEVANLPKFVNVEISMMAAK